MVLGHDLSAGNRTQDVRISEDVSFGTMLLRKATLKGLTKAGLLRPSPVQLHGIPLGKCGFDLLLEAKSGTGKTAVFTTISLEKLDLDVGVQTIILAPTREIASQISSVITEIGSQYKGLNVAVVMGGLPVKEDVEKFTKKVHIVVGSPGRLRHLIQDKHIDISTVRLFVLDEADKLMESSFLRDINYIFSLLPKEKQVIMSSATYSEETKTFISKYVQKAQHVCPDSNNVLLGIAQKVVMVPHNSNIVKQTKHRYEALKKILNAKQFKQCLVFCNYQVRVGELHRMLSRDKWPAEQLYGQQGQMDRLDALKTLQEYKCRILVSTDLAARGIDASNVDVVINFEPPYEWETYLHRIGRAGRYGSYGTAISILSEGKEIAKFKETLALTNIQFNLRDLWNDEPFNLSLTDDSLDNEAPVSISTNNAIIQNEDKAEDKNMLWKALTGSLEQHDIKPKISSFKELCDSFKMTSKPNIETFSDLMHSFKMNKNESSNKDSFEFKHVKVPKLPMEHCVKYWDNLDAKYINQVNGLPNVNDTPLNGDSVKETERYLTMGMEKESSKKYLSECDEIATPKILNYKNSKPDDNISEAKDFLQKDLGKISDDIEIDSIKQNLHNMDLPVTFGKVDLAKRHSKIQKYHDLNNQSNSSDTKINSIEQDILETNLQTVFGKKKKHDSHSNSDYHNEINTNKTDFNEQILVDEDATILEKCKQNGHSSIHGYHDYEITSNNSEVNPMEQALINAGLPTAFGKNKQNKTHNKIHTYRHSDYHNEGIKINKSKVIQNQQRSTKIQVTDRNKLKSISSSKTFTRENYKHKCLPTTDVESDLSNTSSNENCNEKNISKLRNDYTINGSSYYKTPCHHKSIKNSNSKEQKREKQFDSWYKLLNYQTRFIQHALYIEDLTKL